MDVRDTVRELENRYYQEGRQEEHELSMTALDALNKVSALTYWVQKLCVALEAVRPGSEDVINARHYLASRGIGNEGTDSSEFK